MPIYEFYCPDCHVIMNFFSHSVNTSNRPKCPHCKARKLQRQVSLFSAGSAGKEDDGAGELPIDESKMEQAVESLAAEAGAMNEEDPRAAAQLMRKFSHLSGMEFNEGIEEALQRMESGEDPEAIEAELDGALGDEDPFVLPGQKGAKGKRKHGKSRGAPRRDDALYDM
ncbi:MAG: zinc ribbon domain-containing protein [Verrucomicrobia bacterium]|nr:zinc ribbon domain-containing protein [Verrucomicrobiota bacterium]